MASSCSKQLEELIEICNSNSEVGAESLKKRSREHMFVGARELVWKETCAVYRDFLRDGSYPDGMTRNQRNNLRRRINGVGKGGDASPLITLDSASCLWMRVQNKG